MSLRHRRIDRPPPCSVVRVAVLEDAFGDRVFDAVGQPRTSPGTRSVATSGAYFGEVGATLGGIATPLHRSVSRPEPAHRHRDVTEPAIHRLQADAQVTLAVRSAGLGNLGRTTRIVAEIP